MRSKGQNIDQSAKDFSEGVEVSQNDAKELAKYLSSERGNKTFGEVILSEASKYDKKREQMDSESAQNAKTPGKANENAKKDQKAHAKTKTAQKSSHRTNRKSLQIIAKIFAQCYEKEWEKLKKEIANIRLEEQEELSEKMDEFGKKFWEEIQKAEKRNE
ncbi:hypothetical protein niasHT_020949 [Heterodera trifolii]|uniref:Uncharacterized protein n=1 Tax=Heterodera trifolii TaxID=157864 RepID=A0ABD2KCL0_9BILA